MIDLVTIEAMCPADWCLGDSNFKVSKNLHFLFDIYLNLFECDHSLLHASLLHSKRHGTFSFLNAGIV